MKRTIYLFTLLLFATISALGQYSETRIGFKLLPGITNTYNAYEQQQVLQENQPRFTFNFGGQFIQSLKDSTLFIETGFYYTDRGNLQKDLRSQYAAPGSNITKSDIATHHYYYSVPLLLRIEGEYLYLAIGGTVDYYSQTKLVWTQEDRSEKKTLSTDQFQFGAMLNVGTQLKLTDRCKLFIEGSINPSDISIDPNNNKYSFFWNYLLGTGLTFKL